MTTDMSDSRADYPAHEASDVVLRSGSTLRLRPVRPEDWSALLEFQRRLPPDSVYFRFFGAAAATPDLARAAAESDYRDRFGYVGDAAGRIVAAAHYRRTRRGRRRRRGHLRRGAGPAGAGHRDPAPRAARRDRPGARHHDVRGAGAGAEPADARRVRQLRLRAWSAAPAPTAIASSSRSRRRRSSRPSPRTAPSGPPRRRWPASSSRAPSR